MSKKVVTVIIDDDQEVNIQPIAANLAQPAAIAPNGQNHLQATATATITAPGGGNADADGDGDIDF